MAATHKFDEMTGNKQIQETSKHSTELNASAPVT
jgi:hypothetical protein